MAGRALRRLSTEQVVAWTVMAAVTGFVLWQLFPDLLLRRTTPADGDLGAHLQAARSFRDHLLPYGRLTGWSPDWFTGYPQFTFYFPLGFLLVALVDLLAPFTIALKLVAAAGPVALPLSAYAFGRLNRCDRLTSACFGVSVLPLLLQPTLYFAGGSLSASAAGEFSYGLAQALALLVVGLARAGLRTGRHRATTAALLGATVLLHLVQAAMAVVAVAVATVMRPTRERLRWTGAVLAVAGLLVSFWLLPLLLRTHLTAGVDEAKAAPLLSWLLPVEMLPVAALAAAGALVPATRRPEEPADLMRFLGLMAAASGLVFAAVPGGRVSNTRFVAVWYLWLCLLAGYGLSRLGRALDERQRGTRGRALRFPAPASFAAPVAALAAVLLLFDSRGRQGLLTRTPSFGQTTTAELRFAGYEGGADRAEYEDFIETMQGVARAHGCGRAHAETTAANWSDLRLVLIWQTPLWTDGCITTTTGLYLQSSPTSRYVVLTGLRLSSASTATVGGGFDLAAGVAGLRTLGVRYFLASTPATVQAADASSDLRPVAETRSYGERSWKVYEVVGTTVVEPLRHLPVVVPGVGSSRTGWESAVERWAGLPETENVVVAASGPSTWPRARRVSGALPRRAVAEATVTAVRVDRDRVSFRVSRTGVPVLVKVSYFPNWRAAGAEGPWRVTPNQMVVVPTSKTVTLRYGWTPVDYAGWAATLAGVSGLVVLARRRPIYMPAPTEPGT